MTIRKSIQYLLLLVLIGAAVYTLARPETTSGDKAALGKAAPFFSLTDLYGNEIRLDDYRGKGVLLNFWASWCNPCVNELPLLNEAYKLAGVEILAINVGEKHETVQKFVDRYELAFPVVLDSGMKIKQKYLVAGLPLTVLINAEGDLIERFEGEWTEMADILNLMERIRGN